MTFLVFLTVFVALFGPKFFGVIDLSTFGCVVGLVLILPRIRSAVIPRELTLVSFLLLLIMAHTILVIVGNGDAELYPLLRHVRATASTLLLGFVFYNLGRRKQINSRKLLDVLLLCLVTNAIVIVAQIEFPSLKPLMAETVGFDKRFVVLRGFGLTAGYDTAGYLCVFGAIIAAMCAYSWKGVRYQALVLFFLAVTVFTSRSTMALALLVAASIIVLYLANGRLSLRINATILGLSGITVAVLYIIPLLAATFSFVRDFGVDHRTNELDFVGSFAATELSKWKESMWILPDDAMTLLVGAGTSAPQSDLGYVKVVFMVGLFGFAWIMAVYLAMFLFCKRIWSQCRSARSGQDEGLKILASCACIFIVVLLAINVKNLYFLTRIYHELIVILVFFAVGLNDWSVSHRVVIPPEISSGRK